MYLVVCIVARVACSLRCVAADFVLLACGMPHTPHVCTAAAADCCCCCCNSVMSLAASKRASELEQSLNAWEDNRLLTSGVVKLKQVREIHTVNRVWRQLSCEQKLGVGR